MTDYKFTQDWFSHNIPVWEQLKGLLPGEPGSREFLEIGSEKPVDLGLLAYLGGIIGRGAAFFEGLEKFRFLAEIGKDFVVSALCRFSLVVTDEGTAIPVKHREEMPR